MDATVKVKWLQALRGGEYEQERCSVGRGKKLCCIGVGGDALGMDQENEFWTGTCSDRLGLTHDEINHLVRMNDSEKKSFAEIADWIEVNITPDDVSSPLEQKS